jgi:hypothetical protein
MAHPTQEELLKLIEQARLKIEVGASYVHYKSAGKAYKVLDFVVIEATDEIGVLYQAEYGQNLNFVRPVSSWLEKVEHDGQVLPRFSKI